ncbi:MAG: 3-oxoacyl-ACP reductase FabG [Thermoleophilaceae bacterium]|nr:3-oxoacyl-ACP reductase FabG [Thermoleophilaceae bacterium]
MAAENGAPRSASGAALVTGGSRGIGAAVARALAAEGWPVGVSYRSGADAAAGVVDAIEADGGRAMAVSGDVAELGAADRLLGAVEEAFGPVLVLVNNAGVREDGLAVQIDDGAWDRVLDTNLSGAFRLTRRALRPMIKARFGRIVNVASVVGTRASPGQANYAASKAGVIGMTGTVAAEVARRGVTVNAVAPGLVDTDMTRDLSTDILDSVPARRAGTPEEVAACVRFLASEEAAYVTGATLAVDGGLSA